MWLDNASDIDILFYKPYADIVTEIAEDDEYKPLTIGIFGEWGAGKSTLLNLVRQNIESQPQDKKTICIDINAWAFEGYEDAKIAVMQALLQKLEESAPERVKDKLKVLLKRVDVFKLAMKTVGTAAPIVAGVASGNPLPIMFSFNNVATIGDDIKKASEALQSFRDNYLTQDTDEQSVVNSIRIFRSEFEKALDDKEIGNVIVLIDDLDRCQPDRIIETLEAIKLFLSVRKTVFIIAADDKVIQYAIKKKYPPVEGTGVSFEKEYIEKIIQLPITIPQLSSKDVENYLLLLVVQQYLKKDEFKKFLEIIWKEKLLVSATPISRNKVHELLSTNHVSIGKDFNDTLEVVDSIKGIISRNLKGNPRQAKRFLNTYVTKKKLASFYFGEGEEKVDNQILALLLVLYKLSPDRFRQLNEWNQHFLTENEEFHHMKVSLENDDADEFSEWRKPDLIRWVKSTPDVFYTHRLDKYFYLTRECLNGNIENDSNLSEEAKEMLEEIGNAKPAQISKTINNFESINPKDKNDVMEVLLKRTSDGEMEPYIIGEIFVRDQLSAYRPQIANAMMKRTKNASIADVTVYKRMHNTDSELMDKIIDEWKKNSLIDNRMINMIRKG